LRQISARVSDWFIRTGPRLADRPQRFGLRARYNVHSDRVLKVLARMEASVEHPMSREELAATAGASLRQIEHLFAGQLRESMNESYLRIRLEKAEQLLRTTGHSATTIGLACGFKSSSHFSNVQGEVRVGTQLGTAAAGKESYAVNVEDIHRIVCGE
jgi:AraC family carnitine catabolism transcriptional activator